jgi:hypothetical protein
MSRLYDAGGGGLRSKNELWVALPITAIPRDHGDHGDS